MMTRKYPGVGANTSRKSQKVKLTAREWVALCECLSICKYILQSRVIFHSTQTQLSGIERTRALELNAAAS